MAPQQTRQDRIREMLDQKERLGVDELARKLKVTTMTIRRDLATMEKAGLLTRVHGGCVPRGGFVREQAFEEKSQQKSGQKLAIARQVAGRLKKGNSIYLDTGTTAVQVARALPSGKNLRVFTNNLSVAMELFARTDVQVTVYGGTLAGRNPDLVGESAVANIMNFSVDVAVLGADALDTQRGQVYSADMASAALSRTARKNARQVIVVADSSKFGKSSLALVGRLTKDTTLVTDNDVSPRDRNALSRTKARIIYVNYKH